MATLSQTYSFPVKSTDVYAFISKRKLQDKIQITENHSQWYIFKSDYFSEDALHEILDDLYDSVAETA